MPGVASTIVPWRHGSLVMKRWKGCGCCRSPNNRAKRCWSLGLLIGLPATTALVCLVAHARERDAGYPDISPELASFATVQMTDAGAPDVATGSNQVPATLDRGTQAFDASAQPEDAGQADRPAAPPAPVDAESSAIELSTSTAPSPPATGALPASRVSTESPPVLYGSRQDSAPARMPYAGLGLDLGVSGVLPAILV